MTVDYAPPPHRADAADRVAAALRAGRLARHGQINELQGVQVLRLGPERAVGWSRAVRIVPDPAVSRDELPAPEAWE